MGQIKEWSWQYVVEPFFNIKDLEQHTDEWRKIRWTGAFASIKLPEKPFKKYFFLSIWLGVVTDYNIFFQLGFIQNPGTERIFKPFYATDLGARKVEGVREPQFPTLTAPFEVNYGEKYSVYIFFENQDLSLNFWDKDGKVLFTKVYEKVGNNFIGGATRPDVKIVLEGNGDEEDWGEMDAFEVSELILETKINEEAPDILWANAYVTSSRNDPPTYVGIKVVEPGRFLIGRIGEHLLFKNLWEGYK